MFQKDSRPCSHRESRKGLLLIIMSAIFILARSLRCYGAGREAASVRRRLRTLVVEAAARRPADGPGGRASSGAVRCGEVPCALRLDSRPAAPEDMAAGRGEAARRMGGRASRHGTGAVRPVRCTVAALAASESQCGPVRCSPGAVGCGGVPAAGTPARFEAAARRGRACEVVEP